MKRNLVATILILLLALNGLWAAFLVMQYNRNSSRLSMLQARANEINNTRTLLQAIANDAMAYSRRKPELLPILQQFGLAPGGTPATPAPAPTATAQPKAASKASTSKK